MGRLLVAGDGAADSHDQDGEGEDAEDEPEDFGFEEVGQTAFLHGFGLLGDLVEVFFAVHVI